VDHGQIIATGTPAELIAAAKSPPRVTFTAARAPDPRRLEALAAVTAASVDGERAVLHTTQPSRTIIDLVNWIQADEGNELVDLHIHKPSLEDVFIELTGRSLRE